MGRRESDTAVGVETTAEAINAVPRRGRQPPSDRLGYVFLGMRKCIILLVLGANIEAPMSKLRTEQSPRQAFIAGFWRGLAAPMMLYMPSRPQQPVEFVPLPERKLASPRDDLAAIGGDFHAAFARLKTQRG